jgi:hypothetical protein
MAGPFDSVGQPQQRDNMARAGLIDRGVKACKRTDVDHGAIERDSFDITMASVPAWKGRGKP